MQDRYIQAVGLYGTASPPTATAIAWRWFRKMSIIRTSKNDSQDCNAPMACMRSEKWRAKEEGKGSGGRNRDA